MSPVKSPVKAGLAGRSAVGPVVVRTGSLSLRLQPRGLVVGTVVAVGLVLLSLTALGLGGFRVSVVDVALALVGQGPEAIQTLIVKWRLSRVVLAILIGFSLGVSGAVFQSITRNPLGSPDVVGFSAGAYTGALVAIIWFGAAQRYTVPGALVGGIGTALAVYLLAYRRGVHGFRLVVVGIAVTAMLGSLNTYLLLHTELWRAQLAAVWGAGSLNGLDWSEVRAVGITAALVLPPILLMGRRLELIEMGDDGAAALGVGVERVRLAAVVLGVCLVAVSSAVTGPITFVALAAPHVARRISGGSGLQLVLSGLVGAALLLVCDVVAQQAFAPKIFPVGLVTVVIGGAYLAWLLARHAREELT